MTFFESFLAALIMLGAAVLIVGGVVGAIFLLEWLCDVIGPIWTVVIAMIFALLGTTILIYIGQR